MNPPETAPPPRETPHLFAAVIALAVTAVLIGVGQFWGARIERRFIHALAPETFPLKNQGIALQKRALRERDILPLYGSSELIKPIPDKAGLFFQNEPTGFEVSPVGKAGTTSLILLQKLAALGGDLRGKKVAVSISPGWFFVEVINPRYYDGNFSLLAASETIFGHRLSLNLKRDAARRMLQFPRTLEKSALLETALHDLTADTAFSRAVYHTMQPLGWAQNIILRLQDHFETIVYITGQQRLGKITQPNEEAPGWPPNWEALLAQVEAQHDETADREEGAVAEAGPGVEDQALIAGGDRAFVEKMQRAREWTDFELLLRGLKELGAKPLLLSMPINGRFYDRAGVSRVAREGYYARLHELARRYDLPLMAFEDRDEDPGFLMGHHDHLSRKGWMYYNKTLDDFFHNRPRG
jgi:D-alanine transfer protein